MWRGFFVGVDSFVFLLLTCYSVHVVPFSMPKIPLPRSSKKKIVDMDPPVQESDADFFTSLPNSSLDEDAHLSDHDHVEPSWTGPSFRPAELDPDRHVKRWVKAHDAHADQSSFTENINWRLFRILAEFVEGFEFLSRLSREVSIFGSARMTPDDPYYQIAIELGYACARAGFAVITGGGPGIMEAANRGADMAGGQSVGLNIQLPREQRENPYVNHSLGFRYFFTRKVMLSAAAQAYVFFPGGIGTLNELIEMVELIQTGKASDRVPVILVGSQYWEGMLAWIEQVMLEHGMIDQKDLHIFQVVDTVDEAMRIILKTSERVL